MSHERVAARAARPEPLLRACLVLVRPRVALMVFLVTAAGAAMAPAIMNPGSSGLGRCLEAALYVTLVTACASILNQAIERDTDGRMERTRNRPLVTGRVPVRESLFAAVVFGLAGVAGLALSFNLLSAFLALATLVLYVGVYTPMKKVSTLNTVVGAVPGAAPPLLGYVALGGAADSVAWILFAIVFAWQFPHFMAIAWLYRDDYRRAGLRMLPCLPNSAGIAGRQAVLYSLVLLLISLTPVVRGLTSPIYAFGALLLGVAYVVASVRFALREDPRRARVLLYTSLLYLPAIFALLLLDPTARIVLARSLS